MSSVVLLFFNAFPFWTSSFQPTVWPGEPVLMMLDDLEFQWKRGRLPDLIPAMELVMLALLNADSPEKVWMSFIKTPEK